MKIIYISDIMLTIYHLQGQAEYFNGNFLQGGGKAQRQCNTGKYAVVLCINS